MEEQREKIRVVYCAPGQLARITEIGTELANLQQAVGGGLIETFYPFEEEVCIVCNDYLAESPKKNSPCKGCCYAPCVSFCMKKCMNEVFKTKMEVPVNA